MPINKDVCDRSTTQYLVYFNDDKKELYTQLVMKKQFMTVN